MDGMALGAGITVKKKKVKLIILSKAVKNKDFSKINRHSPVIMIISRKESIPFNMRRNRLIFITLALFVFFFF